MINWNTKTKKSTNKPYSSLHFQVLYESKIMMMEVKVLHKNPAKCIILESKTNCKAISSIEITSLTSPSITWRLRHFMATGTAKYIQIILCLLPCFYWLTQQLKKQVSFVNYSSMQLWVSRECTLEIFLAWHESFQRLLIKHLSPRNYNCDCQNNWDQF